MMSDVTPGCAPLAYEMEELRQIMSDKYWALLHRAKWDKLSQEEIAAVAEELRKPNSEADHYTLLHILGKSGATSYRTLIEQFLESDEDPLLAKLALQILCSFWGDTSRYRDQVLRFLRGVSWDESEDCRLIAISVAGEYLRDHFKAEFLHELVQIYENKNEEQLTREAAYSALARAMGRSYQEIPSASRSFDLIADTDPMVLRQAKARLGRGYGE